MRTNAKYGLLVLLVLCLGFYSLSRERVDSYRTGYSYQLHRAALPVPNEIVQAFAGEFKGLVADYLLLEAASFIGSRESFSADSEDWDAVARLLEQSSVLDPYFRQTYILTQATLPWRAKKYPETLRILERSKENLPWDWVPGFFLGFDYHFFLNDNRMASNMLMEAALIKQAPTTLATFASRLASDAGQTSAGIDFLTSVYEKTEDEQAKINLAERIVALKGVLEIQSAIGRFQSQFGRMPDTLDELVENAIITAIPKNPYGRPYMLRDGKVEF